MYSTFVKDLHPTIKIENNKIISAFDVGPGMAILNDYVFHKKKKFYDKNGADSSRGKIKIENNKIIFFILSKLD